MARSVIVTLTSVVPSTATIISTKSDANRPNPLSSPMRVPRNLTFRLLVYFGSLSMTQRSHSRLL